MRTANKIAAIIAIFTLLAPPPAAFARTRKGDKFWKDGHTAERGKKYDLAVDLYEKAYAEDPADPGYQLSLARARVMSSSTHVDAGQKLRTQGQLDEALKEFERAYQTDPSSAIAEQEIQRTRQMIEREKKKEAAGTADPVERGLTPVEIARKTADDRIERIQSLPELKPLSPTPINLKMNNQPVRVLYETVGKLAGVNVLLDPDLVQAGGRNQSVEFTNSTIDEALDHLAVLTKTFWKPISSNAIFVTQDNTTKRRDYEEQVVRVFYLKNVQTPQELQEIATNVRGICDIRRLFTYNAQMAIIVRAEADRVALAEKVIADLDKPRSEVLIDVLVLQASHNYSRDLNFTATPSGINTPVVWRKGEQPKAATTTTDTTTTTTDDTTAVNGRKFTYGGYSVVVPNGQISAILTDSKTRILQSPSVRVADNGKAKLNIGDRVPIAQGSFQPGFGGSGLNPLVNTQFQFIDVGVNVDITPKIHSADEVSMKVDLDISQVNGNVDLGGISQPIIGQNKVSFEVRAREGEVNVIGGLLKLQESRTKSGIPFLEAIPIIGRLFSRETIDKPESELIFILIPHIVRGPEVTENNLRGIAVGNDQVVKLSYSPKRGAAAAAESTKPATTTPATATPATAAPPVTAPPITDPEPPAPKPAEPAKPVGPRLTLTPATADAAIGEQIAINLTIDDVTDLNQIPMRLRYDPKVVHLTDVRPGALLSKDGLNPAPVIKNIQNDTGAASITVGRLPGAGGISGSGVIATFVFQVVGAGNATLAFQELSVKNLRNEEIKTTPPEATITVK